MTHPQQQPGRLEFTVTEGTMRITHADPVVECPGEWLDRVVHWRPGGFRTPLAHSEEARPDRPVVDMVTFHGEGRSWTYRITAYDALRHVYTLAWPD